MCVFVSRFQLWHFDTHTLTLWHFRTKQKVNKRNDLQRRKARRTRNIFPWVVLSRKAEEMSLCPGGLSPSFLILGYVCASSHPFQKPFAASHCFFVRRKRNYFDPTSWFASLFRLWRLARKNILGSCNELPASDVRSADVAGSSCSLSRTFVDDEKTWRDRARVCCFT